MPYTLRRHRLLVWLSLYLAVVAIALAWVGSGIAMPPLVAVPVELGVIALAFRARREAGIHTPVGRGWLLLAGAVLFRLLGDLVWSYDQLRTGIVPFPSVADGLYLGFLVLSFAGLSVAGLRRREGGFRLSLAVDLAIVLVVTSLVTAYLLLAPAVALQYLSRLELAVAILYPVGDLLVLLTTLGVLSYRERRWEWPPLLWLVLAFLLFGIADFQFGFLRVQSRYRTGDLVDILWYMGYLLIGYAAAARMDLPAQPAAQPEAQFSALRAAILPTSAIAVGFTVMTAVTLRSAAPAWVRPVLGWVDLLIGLVMIRQWLTLHANRQLLEQSQQLAKEVQRREERFSALVQNSSDVIVVLSGEGVIRYISPASSRVLGAKPVEVVGTPFSSWVHPADLDYAAQALASLVRHYGSTLRVELRVGGTGEEWRVVEIAASNSIGLSVVDGLILNLRDVTVRTELEEQLRKQSFHDPLTGLANRALFVERIAQSLHRVQRGGALPVVIFVSLDDFKTINETHGHSVGDTLLSEVAERLRRLVDPHDTVAAFGGDHFAILLDEADGAQGRRLADEVVAAIGQPFDLPQGSISAFCRVGVAAECRGASTPDELLRCADLAMYAAKELPQGRVAFYHPRMSTQLDERIQLQDDLKRAVAQREFRVYFQPTFWAASGKIKGMEALVRWQHPTRGLMGPGQFIPLAEETGLIVQIGRQVLVEACRRVRAWQAAYPQLGLTVNVNLSGRQLAEPGVVAEVAETLRTTGLSPQSLILEITETVLVKADEGATELLRQLKGLGIRLAIDDFGTGYSSLAYLQRFPFDIVKIDRCFVEPLGTSLRQAALTQGIIDLARSLSLETVAEGVERPQQLLVLKQMGCDVAQGYLFARPMPSDSLTQMLERAVKEEGAPS